MLRLRLYGHTERTNNERMPKQIVTEKNEGTQKVGRSQKRWTDEVEEDWKIIGTKIWPTLARDRKERRKILFGTKVTTDYST